MKSTRQDFPGAHGHLLAARLDAPDGAIPRRVNLPQELAPDELTAAKAQELVDAPVVTDRIIGVNPENGKEVVAKDGRFGPYVTEVEPEPDVIAPVAPAAE